MAVTAREGLKHLEHAADDGSLATECESLGIDLLGVFGSALDPAAENAHDLDVAVRFVGKVDLLGVIDVLVRLTGYDHIDVAVVDGRHPVIDSEALAGLGLYERESGEWAEAQMAAAGHLRDTAWLRELDLHRMAR